MSAKVKIKLSLLSLAFALLASCWTFPSSQLSLDLRDQSVPIMLSNPDPGGTAVTMHFESGYSSMSVSTFSTYRGATTSSTVTFSTDLSTPLANQLSNVLVQRPQWIYVSSLLLKTNKFVSIYLSTVSYVLGMDLTVSADK
jgi:hypothetical protein